MPHYTIRYRANDTRGRTALIVEDPHGAAYLVCDGRLQACLAPSDIADPCGRLAALLSVRAVWSPVSPSVACTSHGLRRFGEVPAEPAACLGR